MENGPNNWKPKMLCCFPLWLFILCLLVIPIIILVFVMTVDIPKPEMNSTQVNGATGHLGVLEGMVIAAIGLPAAGGLRFFLLMLKNLIFNQDVNIRKGMDNERVSSQLGFMNEVRKEMWFLSRFVQFMEVFEGRRIRVVLNITSLDRCSPKKIVAVLNAINILLSDDESPFISILAANPGVLIEKVNFADGGFFKEERAHALLKRIVTLAFTVPPLCDDSKCSLLYSTATNSKISNNVTKMENDQRTKGARKTSSSDGSLVEVALETKELNPLIKKRDAALNIKDEEVEDFLRNILGSDERKLNKYISDDTMFMKRVINSIRVTVIIMKASEIELPQPQFIAAWVVLANEWPCRLSWIIQCVEDAQQRANTEQRAGMDDATTLWKVFCKSRAELYVMSAQIEDLLEQDGDPELFERFLRVDFQFSIKDLRTFKVALVNLDHTIKEELALIRGTSRLKDSGWMRDLAPLPITTIIKMDTEDVCKEVRRSFFSQYL